MAPGSRCMSGNTCGCRISWTYRRAVMVPRINTKAHYSTKDKINLFADSLESSFQEIPEPYDDDIEHVKDRVERYMDRNAIPHH
ncbi:hypothetical protein TNCV_3719931 [Trichonephila clavipes]|nr:hypothetical protein TNCV_3719931 [Trichonephila clavipes]